MSATIYYLSDYARLRRRRHRVPAVEDDHRQQAIVTFGILIFAVVLIIVGVLLIDGIATVGRSNSDCLQSGRRVCGFFHSAFIQDRLQPRGVAEGSHMAVHHELFRAA
jgi:hypothetical protein